jgi:hypothetical protein
MAAGSYPGSGVIPQLSCCAPHIPPRRPARAGADSIDDVGLPRHAAMQGLFGGIS